MKKCALGGRFARGAISILLVLAVALALCPARAEAAGGKDSRTRAIAIVFDNSGSMYIRGNQAWCRATVAGGARRSNATVASTAAPESAAARPNNAG